MVLLTTIFIVFLVYLLSKLWSCRTLNYWKDKGVKSPEASPIFGNIAELMTGKKSIGEIYMDIYKQFKDCPWIGIYNWRTPNLMICHPDLIRQILVKDFNYFHDNIIESNEKNDPLLSRNPFVLKGDKWKETRTQLAPAFAPAKLKTVVPNIKTVAERMLRYIKNNTGRALELKELCTRFTTDNVFSIMYSMDSESFIEEKAENWKMIRTLFVPSVSLTIRSTILFFLPRLADLLRLGLFPRYMNEALLKISKEAQNERKNNNLVYNDMLTTLSELKDKKTGRTFSDVDIAGHSAGFITDGLETSAVSLSFALYEIAANPDVQEKLYQEITSAFDTYGDEISYENIQEMSYLDRVCSETLRIHSPALFLTRLCTEKCILTSPYNSNETLVVEKDFPIILPVLGLHLDPKYFPKPEVFNPDRFAPENRHNIVRGSYLPFGDGPRVCIGQKLALLQMKLGLIYILKEFRIKVNEKTKVPLEIDPLYFILSAKGGLWVNFEERRV